MRITVKSIIYGLYVLALASCISPALRDWPDAIPAMASFEDAWESDAANRQLQSRQVYLEWVMVFYQGNLINPTGWSDLQDYLHPIAVPGQQELIAAQLADLGSAIGAEWSKHNSLRLIDNRMLSLWGSVVQLAPTIDKQQQSIAYIQQDVALLLAGDINGVNIHEERYEQALDLELFDGF